MGTVECKMFLQTCWAPTSCIIDTFGLISVAFKYNKLQKMAKFGKIAKIDMYIFYTLEVIFFIAPPTRNNGSRTQLYSYKACIYTADYV